MNETTQTEPKTWYEIWLPRISLALIVLMVVGFGVQWVFTSTSSFLITLIMAFFVAFALLPAVEFLSRRGWRRGAAACCKVAMRRSSRNCNPPTPWRISAPKAFVARAQKLKRRARLTVAIRLVYACWRV